MKILENKLKSRFTIRTEQDYPTKGIEFIDITPLILNKDVYNEINDIFVKELEGMNIDYIVAPEARGFLFGSTVAHSLGVGCIPVRKKGKLPPIAVAATFDYEKEYGKDTLELTKLVDGDYNNKNFYIIDDIYATGNTVRAISNAIKDLGGNVLGTGVVMNIKALNNDSVFAIMDVEEE